MDATFSISSGVYSKIVRCSNMRFQWPEISTPSTTACSFSTYFALIGPAGIRYGLLEFAFGGQVVPSESEERIETTSNQKYFCYLLVSICPSQQTLRATRPTNYLFLLLF